MPATWQQRQQAAQAPEQVQPALPPARQQGVSLREPVQAREQPALPPARQQGASLRECWQALRGGCGRRRRSHRLGRALLPACNPLTAENGAQHKSRENKEPRAGWLAHSRSPWGGRLRDTVRLLPFYLLPRPLSKRAPHLELSTPWFSQFFLDSRPPVRYAERASPQEDRGGPKKSSATLVLGRCSAIVIRRVRAFSLVP